MKDTKRSAQIYDFFMRMADFFIVGKWRSRLWDKVEGTDILEAGAGTGSNIPYFKPGQRVALLDNSKYFLQVAKKKAVDQSIEISYIHADLKQIPADDGTFDSVAATFLFCSLDDTLSALQEIKRVLKDGGMLLLLEQGPSATVTGSFLNLMALPLYKLAGASLAPDMGKKVKEADFKDIKIEPVFMDALNIISCRK